MKKQIKKGIGAIALSFVLGLGMFGPFDVADVKAAEAENSDWEVAAVKDEDDAVVEEIGEAADKEYEENEDYLIDEIQLEGRGTKTVSGTLDYAQAYKVLEIVNQKRNAAGLSSLYMDEDLMEAAMLRSAEIVVDFDHTRPCGLDCFTVSEKAYGENIAAGYPSADSVMTGWMNSPGHRSNIMNNSYRSIGIGCFYSGGRYYWVQLFGYNFTKSFQKPANKYTSIDVVTDPVNYELKAHGIKVAKSDPRDGFTMYLQTNTIDVNDIEYSWYISGDDGKSWQMLSDWERGMDGIIASTTQYGDYIVVGKARKAGDNSTIVQYAESYSCHPAIKGICQMPYTGAGGGYLIGIESYENPNHAYTYEMLILDCTLYAQGKDAWIYTTTPCYAPDTCLWTIWQPLYGYYWTLFRIYDENGNLIDQECFGFANIC